MINSIINLPFLRGFRSEKAFLCFIPRTKLIERVEVTRSGGITLHLKLWNYMVQNSQDGTEQKSCPQDG